MLSITDCSESAFQVELVSPRGRVRRRQDMAYLGRGLFLYHYRLFGDYEEVNLEVKHQEGHVAGSPYALGGTFHEDCYCPLATVEEWLKNFDCPADIDPQIMEDLEPFKRDKIYVSSLFQNATESYHSASFVHYSIVDGKVGGDWGCG